MTISVWAEPPAENSAPSAGNIIEYRGDGSDLQQTLDRATAGSVISCDQQRQLTLSKPLVVDKSLTLKHLNAALPPRLGRTSLVIVVSPGVVLRDLELHGNYDSVSQKDRAPLIDIQAGDFLVEDCRFFDATKECVTVSPPGDVDIVGGAIRRIEGFRLGRDAVSLSGGTHGARVRDVVIENVTMKQSYLRGAVEVSDGTDKILVRNVYAEDSLYAVDIQDHGNKRQVNTQVTVDNVTAVNCRHVVRTANHDFGHAGLTLRGVFGRNCEKPLQVSHTSNVRIENVSILEHSSSSPGIHVRNCLRFYASNVLIQAGPKMAQPIKVTGSKAVVENLNVVPLAADEAGNE